VRIVYPLLWSRPDRKACRQQTMGTVAALARRGHEVTLLMPRGERDSAFHADELRAYFQVEGQFELLQRPSPWAGDALVRTLLWLRQVFHDPALLAADILYSRIPAMFGVGSLSPVPFATDHYRPWPDDLPAARSFIRRTSRHRNCLGLILHSAYAASAYERAGVDPARILVAHNGVETSSNGVPTRGAARARLGLPADRAVAVYAGRLNAEKGLDQVFALAERRPDVLFLLVGSEGEGPIEVEARSRANVQIVPWQPPEDLPIWLAAADLLLVPASREPLEKYRNCVMPLKLISYLAAGRPILAPEAPDTAELLIHRHNAMLVPSGDPAAGVVAIDAILNEQNLARSIGEAARLTASGLTWDRRAEKIEGFLVSRSGST